MNLKQVYIKNFGCKVNLTDAHQLAAEFTAQGYPITTEPSQAGIIVLNSCSVTHKAEQDARYHLRKFHKLNPEALKVITGCYAQIDSHSLAQLPEVHYVIPNQDKSQLVRFIHTKVRRNETLNPSIAQPSSKTIPGTQLIKHNRQSHFKSALNNFGSPSSRQTRAFIKIQDGCNDFCSYCQIPLARGQSQSVPPHKVLKQIHTLAAADFKEIVITGIHLGEWGEDLPGSPKFTDLLSQIFRMAGGTFRLRLSSLEPSEFKPELAELLHTHKTRMCAHFHFPLQSGSARILQLMRRRYTPEQYLLATHRARKALGADAHISADVMVGFPGETHEDFQQTVDLIKQARLSSIHVFPYSKRPNTSALRLPDHLSHDTIQTRARTLRQLNNQLIQAYTAKFINTQLEILWESTYDHQGRIVGKSSEYLKVCAAPTTVTPGTMTLSTAMGLTDIRTLYTKHHLLLQPNSASPSHEPTKPL